MEEGRASRGHTCTQEAKLGKVHLLTLERTNQVSHRPQHSHPRTTLPTVSPWETNSDPLHHSTGFGQEHVSTTCVTVPYTDASLV